MNQIGLTTDFAALRQRNNLMGIFPDDSSGHFAAAHVNHIREVRKQPSHVARTAHVISCAVAKPANTTAARPASGAVKQLIGRLKSVAEPVEFSAQFGMRPGPLSSGRRTKTVIGGIKNSGIYARIAVTHGAFETDKHGDVPRGARSFQTDVPGEGLRIRPKARPDRAAVSADYLNKKEHLFSPLAEPLCLQVAPLVRQAWSGRIGKGGSA